jgi:hypothetical protein
MEFASSNLPGLFLKPENPSSEGRGQTAKVETAASESTSATENFPVPQ